MAFKLWIRSFTQSYSHDFQSFPIVEMESTYLQYFPRGSGQVSKIILDPLHRFVQPFLKSFTSQCCWLLGKSKPKSFGKQIINDPVHGVIELHPLLVKIINTPEFGRLKDIKQLGVCYWIYPGASHNRFEHSIGTSHLCGKMIDSLQEMHRGEIEITDEEALCVKIAGLCHDLGHGPFSHFFDGHYIPRVYKQLQDTPGYAAFCHQKADQECSWTHEDASCTMFDHMVEKNELEKDFDGYHLKKEHMELIKEMIRGKDPKKGTVERVCKHTKKKNWFLFEIVANKRNGIDCDKFDYFARDSLNVGVKSNFDCQRYFPNIRVMPCKEDEDKLMIHVQDKEVINLYELFHTRWSLHHRVYKHKTEAPIEDLLTEALLEVDEDLDISASILEENVHLFANLSNSVFYEILRRGSKKDATKNFQDAREILLRIQRRNLYKYCGQYNLDADTSKESAEEIKKQIIESAMSLEDPPLEKADIFISNVYIHFGMNAKDPIDSVLFFNKKGDYLTAKEVKKSRISKEMLPQKFHERFLRVYAKKEGNIDRVTKAFESWCKNHPVHQ